MKDLHAGRNFRVEIEMHGHHLLIGIGGKRIPSVRGHEQYVVRSGVEARIPACVIRITRIRKDRA